jgi:hypothetical protein
MKIGFVTPQGKKITPRERKYSHFVLICGDMIKVPLFKCQRCGECQLSSTSFTCSQRCPKRLRNGPCGGTGIDGSCEVYPDRKCVWCLIHKRAEWLNRKWTLHPIKKIHNWELEGTSTWVNVFKKRIDPPILFKSQQRKYEETDAS